MKPTIFAILALFICTSCGKETTVEREVVVERKIPNFPYSMELIDNKGRVIEATLIGRTSEVVIFTKEDNTFRFPISNLSQETREIVTAMPVTELTINTNENIKKDSYIAHREKSIEHLTKEIRDLNYDLLEARGDSARVRGINNEIRRVQLEISKERQQIEDYKFRQKQ